MRVRIKNQETRAKIKDLISNNQDKNQKKQETKSYMKQFPLYFKSSGLKAIS